MSTLESFFAEPIRFSDHYNARRMTDVDTSQILPAELFDAAEKDIQTWPGYSPTLLHDLTKLASELGVATVQYKDESTRFGLGSFKALGGAYAVMRILADELAKTTKKQVLLADLRRGDYAEISKNIIVTSATDGNHGRSVAWGAKQVGCPCRIYIHADVSAGREQALVDLDAEVIRVAGNYDESVRICAKDARENGWLVVSDTSYDGYADIPRLVMAGYGLIIREILTQRPMPPITHVFIQAGVGGLAAAIIARIIQLLPGEYPKFVIVEADRAACLIESAKAGRPSPVDVQQETIMAGLSCGEVSLLAWDILSKTVDHFVTIDDQFVGDGMRYLASGAAGGAQIEAGECSVAGLLALIVASDDEDIRQKFDLDADSHVLLIGTEGATDPEIYRSILAGT